MNKLNKKAKLFLIGTLQKRKFLIEELCVQPFSKRQNRELGYCDELIEYFKREALIFEEEPCDHYHTFDGGNNQTICDDCGAAL